MSKKEDNKIQILKRLEITMEQLSITMSNLQTILRMMILEEKEQMMNLPKKNQKDNLIQLPKRDKKKE